MCWPAPGEFVTVEAQDFSPFVRPEAAIQVGPRIVCS